jgi:hypothetical protein
MTKKEGALLLGIGAWNVAIWGNFARNLARTAARGEDRPRAYYVAHASLIAVDVAIGAVLIGKGAKALRG